MTVIYRIENGVQIPNLELPEQRELPLGKYAMLRREYLMKHRRGTYTTLLTEAKLTEHLYGIEQSVQTQIAEIVERMARELGVTEQMKAEDPLKWVGMMNNIKTSAEEEVLNSLIYA